MPCEICGTNAVRNYTHSRNAYHRKLLFDKMREKKKKAIALYGYYKWEEELFIKDKEL